MRRDAWIAETLHLMEQHFWSPTRGLYRDEISADWQCLALPRPERQHALLRGVARRLRGHRRSALSCDRAAPLARIASPSTWLRTAGGLVWEHYDPTGRSTGTTTRTTQAPLPPLGLPARPPDRVGQAAAHPRAASAARGRRLAAAARGSCSIPRSRGPGTPSTAASATASRPDGTSATATSISGSRRSRFAAAALLARRTGRKRTGTGTTGSGRTAGSTSSTTSYGAWYRILTPDNRNTATRKARPERPTTTRWEPVTRSSTCWGHLGRSPGC